MADTQLATISPGDAALARPANFEPTSITELELFAKFISDSELAPKDYRSKIANCMVAIMMGRELGLSPMQAIQGIAVINGRPSVWGDALWALVISHPEFAGFEETVTDDKATCKLTRCRRGVTSSVTEEFSMADAKRAGLADKEKTPWTTYPKRMLMWRARTFAARSLFADALKGLTSVEEAGDYIEGQVVSRTPDTPKPDASAPPATATKGDQPKPGPVAVEKDRKINAEEIALWDSTRKLAGWKAEDARSYLTNVAKVTRSGEILLSQLPAAMKWAKTGPKADAAGPKPEDNPLAEPTARDTMNQLGMLMFEQESLITQHTQGEVTNWHAINEVLAVKLREKNGAQG